MRLDYVYLLIAFFSIFKKKDLAGSVKHKINLVWPYCKRELLLNCLMPRSIFVGGKQTMECLLVWARDYNHAHVLPTNWSHVLTLCNPLSYECDTSEGSGPPEYCCPISMI